MKHTTIGMIAGAGVAAGGAGLLYSSVSDININQPAKPSTRVKEVLGAALIIGGVGLALGSGVKALSHKVNPTEAMEAKGRSKVQSLIFQRDSYTVSSAKAWAKSHGYRATKTDVTPNTIRLRQRSPGGRMRTVRFGKGISAVVSFA